MAYEFVEVGKGKYVLKSIDSGRAIVVRLEDITSVSSEDTGVNICLQYGERYTIPVASVTDFIDAYIKYLSE
jgi:hypothetical protein